MRSRAGNDAVSEIEQLLESALIALRQAPSLSAWDKAQICSRLEEQASDAYREFMREDEREMDKQFGRVKGQAA